MRFMILVRATPQTETEASTLFGDTAMMAAMTEYHDALDGGLKNEMFSKIGEKGVSATVITDAANKKITELRVGGRGGKGK